MKKLLLLPVLVLLCNSINAQPWMPTGPGPVKFSDVCSRYTRQGTTGNNRNGNSRSSQQLNGNDQLFDQWAWYWRQHLDKDGYIISSSQTLASWQKYKNHLSANKKLAKTTYTVPSNWVFQGPDHSAGGYSGMGRINAVAFDPIDSNTFYAGSAAGSTWKTTDGGTTWAPLYDFLPSLGVSDIKVNPLNGNTIFVATGDAEAGDSYSSGVIISHDAGANWATTSLIWAPTDNNFIRSLLINPLDTNSLILATNVGIYKSYDAGSTWANVAPGNFKQILYKPGDSNTVYGTIYTDTSAQIVLSTNGGLAWSAVTSFTDAQRINIAVCPASPAVVKAVASNMSSGLKGIYSSSNSGASYTATYTDDISCSMELLGYDLGLPTYTCGGKAWYALCISMNPANANEVTVGSVNTYYSSDGGFNWQIANGWYNDGVTILPIVHANKHCLAYNPLSGALFESCDGGIYKNYSPLSLPWTDISNGLNVTEFYRNAIDNNVPFCLAGASGNGTKMINGAIDSDLAGGIGCQPLINYGNPGNIFYVSSQYGYILMTRDAGVHFHSITDTLFSSGGFITPYALHPTDTATLLLGYNRVYVSHNNGDSWTPNSPVFDSNSFINRLVIARSNANYMYAELDESATHRSLIYATTNGGITWDSIHVPFTNLISDLIIDPRNENQIWVSISGYGTNKVYGYNGAWTNESGSLPDLPINCMAMDTATRVQYVGTDAAVFFKDTTMTDWALYNTHLPTVHVYDLKINYTTGELWAATFGRGVWKSVKADTLPTLSVARLPEHSIKVSPNPSNGLLQIASDDLSLRTGTVNVKLLNTEGKTVWIKNAVFDNTGNMKLNIKGLPAGFYTFELNNSGIVAHANVVLY